MGARGRVCSHCTLDDAALNWELRLFTLTTRALALGAAVSQGQGGVGLGRSVLRGTDGYSEGLRGARGRAEKQGMGATPPRSRPRFKL